MKMPFSRFSKKIILPAAIIFLLLPIASSAHENYVLTKDQINAGMNDFSINVFDALKNPNNLGISIAVAIGSAIAIILYLLFQNSGAGQKFDKKMKSLENYGHAILRIALGASLIASAYTSSFLGPEIPILSIPFPILKTVLYVLGFMLLAGIFTELAGLLFYIILMAATIAYKDYILTYFNYIGEAVALIFFGSRFLSVDSLRKGLSKFTEKYRDWEIAIIRITYGISIIYPAISIKLLHPAIIIQIAKQYNLTQFHWLFPQDPLLISLGTGLAQVAVGISLIFGFETRLNALVTFLLMFMSVLFFKETVWPHFILLALALYLIINNGGEFSLDHYIYKFLERKKTYGKSI